MKISVRVQNFTPIANGFNFTNSWPKGSPIYTLDILGQKIELADASAGLCGGMVFAAMDLFNSGVLPPPGAALPSVATPLFNYIVARLTHSFDLADVDHYLSGIQQPDGDFGLPGAPVTRGLAWTSLREEWPKIKSDLDAGMLSPLGLISGQEPTGVGYLLGIQDLGKCHQVIAWGYDLDGDDLTIRIYDPDYIDDTAAITVDLSRPTEPTAINISHYLPGRYRGFFRTNYEFHDPSKPVSAAYIIEVVSSPGIANGGPLPQLFEAKSTWLDVAGEPAVRFSGAVNDWTRALSIPPADIGAEITRLFLTITTGADDLRGGTGVYDNCDIILGLSTGVNLTCRNVNNGQNWPNGAVKSVLLPIPLGLHAGDIVFLTIHTQFHGDNWNVDRVQLVAAFKSAGVPPLPPVAVREWVRRAGSPLVRFTGDKHVFALPIMANPADAGRPIQSLDLTIRTGDDDLRGGSGPGDNCTIILKDAMGHVVLTRPNVNHGYSWRNSEAVTITLPVPAGAKSGDFAELVIETNFGGGLGGDNWDVDEVVLIAII